MRLISFNTREALSLPGVRPSTATTVEVGVGTWAKWRVHVRGPAVILESPPGWRPSTTGQTIGTGPRLAFEFPRTSVNLRWELEPGDSLAGITNWSSPDPFAQVAPENLPDVGEIKSPPLGSENSPAGILADEMRRGTASFKSSAAIDAPANVDEPPMVFLAGASNAHQESPVLDSTIEALDAATRPDPKPSVDRKIRGR